MKLGTVIGAGCLLQIARMFQFCRLGVLAVLDVLGCGRQNAPDADVLQGNFLSNTCTVSVVMFYHQLVCVWDGMDVCLVDGHFVTKDPSHLFKRNSFRLGEDKVYPNNTDGG